MQAAGNTAPAVKGRLRVAMLAALLAYFVALEWDRVGTYFAADDMMNLATYFRIGPWGALGSQLQVWRGFYRPMGAAFYLPLFHWFGLNPVPFQIAILLILAANIYLAFRFALALGSSNLTAALAALVVSYHAGLSNLHYNVDMIYDVLCFTFFVGGLLLYVSIHRESRLLRWPEMTAFLLLYLCALNSKEMALTLPLVLLVYEWAFHKPAVGQTLPSVGAATAIARFRVRERFPQTRQWVAWLRRPGSVVLFTAVLALASLYGKKFGVQPILDRPAYQPVFSLYRYMAFQKASLHELSGHLASPGWHGVVVFWALVTYLAWRRPWPLLRFTWAYMLLAPLPIAFLTDRTQGCLYIPLVGWAIFASAIFVDVAGAAADFLSREPLLGRLGRGWIFALLAAGGVLFWVNQMRILKATVVKPAAAAQGTVTARVIGQLRELHPRVRPQSQVVFLNDPFSDWDMTFIGTLWFADRSVQVYNQRLEQLSPKEFARMDHVFDFQDGRLVQLK
jgi:hypothetical protein